MSNILNEITPEIKFIFMHFPTGFGKISINGVEIMSSKPKIFVPQISLPFLK